MGMGYVNIGNVRWNVIDVDMHDLHTGARFTQDIDVEYDRTVTGTVYEVISAAADNDRGWVHVHHLDDEGDDPLRTQDGCLVTEGFFGSRESETGTGPVFHFVDPEFYTEPVVHGAQLALALQSLSGGAHIDGDGTVRAWWTDAVTDGGEWVIVPDYGVRALNYAEEHGLAVDIDPGSNTAALTDAGQELLGTFRYGYAKALQAGWTEVPVQ